MPVGAIGSIAMRCLVTAGNTREMIDEVRDWGNIFTGNTGLAIARALAGIGEVDLLTSNRQHLEELSKSPGRVRGMEFSTHATLKAKLSELMSKERYVAIFMTAAVADYRPTGVYEIVERPPDAEFAEPVEIQTWKVRRVSGRKVKSSYRQIAIVGEQTEKIVDLFRSSWGYRGMLVKFKLEVGLSKEELIRAGRHSRAASGADYLVANTLDMVEGAKAGAYVISESGEEFVDRSRLPQRMVELVRQRYTGGLGNS
jgi:phosphopantothenoylcysteine synthetase/decarboxylase